MPRREEELGVDLADLWKAAKYRLVPVAGDFRSAAGRLDLADGSGDTFLRSDKLGGPFGPVREEFEAARDALYQVLITTAENLERTADAMVLTAEEYAKTDSRAKAVFETERGVIAAEQAYGGSLGGWKPQ